MKTPETPLLLQTLYAISDPINRSDKNGLLAGYDLVAKLIQAAFAGYSLVDILSDGDLLSYGAGFIVETACDAVSDSLTAGLGLIFAAIGCGLFGRLVESAVDDSLQSDSRR